MTARTPETIRPRYSAFITLPSLVETKKVPMMEAMMETPPRARGYSTAARPASAKTRWPRSMVATTVTA